MYFVSLFGHGTSSAPSASGAPTECTHGTNGPSSPSTSSASRPMRVMSRMETATYAESVSCTPMWLLSEPTGAIELVAHLLRVAPVVRGPGVLLLRRADERAVLDAGDVTGVRERQVAVRPLRVVQALERPGIHEDLAERVVLLGGAIAPVDGIRPGERGHLLDPAHQLLVIRRDSCGAH